MDEQSQQQYQSKFDKEDVIETQEYNYDKEIEEQQMQEYFDVEHIDEFQILQYCTDYDFQRFEYYDENARDKEVKLINNIKKQIQIKQPHLNILSIPFIKTIDGDWGLESYYDRLYEIGIKVFDVQKMIYKCLIVQYCSDNQLTVVQNLIEKYHQLHHNYNIPELETIQQILYQQDTIMYDVYTIQIYQVDEKQEFDKIEEVSDQIQEIIYESYAVFEVEDLDVPYQNFFDKIKFDNILDEYFKKLQNSLSWRCEDQEAIKSLDNYYVKFTNEDEIQIKSFINVFQFISYTKSDKITYQKSYIYFQQRENILQKIEYDVEQLLRQSINLIQKKLKISKQNLLTALEMIFPLLTKKHEIIPIIQQQPKYNLFSLINFDENTIIFKAWDLNQKYLLKFEKFNSSKDANHKKEQFESLRKFQKDHKGIFLGIGECQVICAESSWYVGMEEKVTVNDKNDKLIGFNQIHRISKVFSHLNCSLDQISLYLIVKNIYYYEVIFKFGFQAHQLFGSQPYLYISDRNKISENKVIFSNPYFDENKDRYSYSELQEKKLIDIFQEQYKNTFLRSFQRMLISCFKEYINYQENNRYNKTLNELHDQFPKLQQIIKQIEYFISIKEQLPCFNHNECFLTERFTIVQTLSIKNLRERKDSLNEMIQFKINKFVCCFEQLKDCQKYLNQDNHIKQLQIRSELQENENDNLIENMNDIIEETKSFFSNVQILSINQLCPQMNQQINSKLFPSLKQIKIKYPKYNNKIHFNLNKLRYILQIFQEKQTFQIIKLNTKIIYNFLSYFIKEKYEVYKESINISHDMKEIYDREVSQIQETFDRFQQSQHLNHINSFEEIKKQILKVRYNYQWILCEVQIQEIYENQQLDHLFVLRFSDISQFNLGQLELSFKLSSQIQNYRFRIESFQCNNQSRFHEEFPNYFRLVELIQKWIIHSIQADFMYQLFGKVPNCCEQDYYEFILRIYQNQTQLKSLTLYILNCKKCSEFNINNFFQQVGLSQGDKFHDLLELRLKFWNNNQYKFLNDVIKMVNNNQNINTIKIRRDQFPKKLMKIKRIVKFIQEEFSSGNKYD